MQFAAIVVAAIDWSGRSMPAIRAPSPGWPAAAITARLAAIFPPAV